MTGNGLACVLALAGVVFLAVDGTWTLSLGFFGLGVASAGMFGRTTIWPSAEERKQVDHVRGPKIDPVELRRWREKHPDLSFSEAVNAFRKEKR